MPQDFTAGQVLTAAQMDTLSGAVDGYATTATAAGTTTLTVASLYQQFFTGSTTQTVVMPVASTLYVGWKVRVVNNSSGVVTVQSSGANTIYAVPAGGDVIFTCILASGTTAASWDYKNHIAASSAAGLVKVTSADFSAVASIELQSIFTSTYKKYIVIFSQEPSAAGNAVTCQWMYATNTVESSANYYGAGNSIDRTNTSTNWGYVGTTSATIMGSSSVIAGIKNVYEFIMNQVGNASEKPTHSFTGFDMAPSQGVVRGAGFVDVARTYTGLKFSISAGTFSGSYQVFGVQN